MKMYLFIILLSFSKTFADELVKSVIKEQKIVCRNGLNTNCIKPINVTGSNVKALEIKVLNRRKAQFITYDVNGTPVDLADGYSLFLKATRVPARIDADIVREPIASINNKQENFK